MPHLGCGVKQKMNKFLNVHYSDSSVSVFEDGQICYISGQQGINSEESCGLHTVHEAKELCTPAGHR